MSSNGLDEGSVSFSITSSDGSGDAHRFVLGPEDEPVKIGRHHKNNVTLSNPGVSWVHCELRLLSGVRGGLQFRPGLCVRDVSSNGVGLKAPYHDEPVRIEKGVDVEVPHQSELVVPFKVTKKKEGYQTTMSVDIDGAEVKKSGPVMVTWLGEDVGGLGAPMLGDSFASHGKSSGSPNREQAEGEVDVDSFRSRSRSRSRSHSPRRKERDDGLVDNEQPAGDSILSTAKRSRSRSRSRSPSAAKRSRSASPSPTGKLRVDSFDPETAPIIDEGASSEAVNLLEQQDDKTSAKAKSKKVRKDKLGPGVVVRVTGLQARAELNGQVGKIIEWEEKGKFWKVRMDDGTGKAFKAVNLVCAATQDRLERCRALLSGEKTSVPAPPPSPEDPTSDLSRLCREILHESKPPPPSMENKNGTEPQAVPDNSPGTEEAAQYGPEVPPGFVPADVASLAPLPPPAAPPLAGGQASAVAPQLAAAQTSTAVAMPAAAMAAVSPGIDMSMSMGMQAMAMPMAMGMTSAHPAFMPGMGMPMSTGMEFAMASPLVSMPFGLPAMGMPMAMPMSVGLPLPPPPALPPPAYPPPS